MDDLITEYNCQDNDNQIRVYALDGKIDEVHFSSFPGEWLVIGYEDLMRAIEQADNLI
jgi:hypothetical protein